MTLDNMTGITEGSYTGFCKSQLITCNRVKECNGVCPFEDALKHADKMQTMNNQHTVDHDRDWIIGCIKHDGFIKTHRFDKANQIILEALQADAVQGEWDSNQACSICGCQPWYEHDIHTLRYCPNCGARMKGGDYE